MPVNLPRLQDNYQRVRDRIAEAAVRSGRKPSDVTLVAVTKSARPEVITALARLGHRDFAENRVVQLCERVDQLQRDLDVTPFGLASRSRPATPEIRWHMIGHLQRNKVKQIYGRVSLFHSVDTLRLAEELQAQGLIQDQLADVLVQVNTSGEESKFGVPHAAAGHLCQQIDSMVHLRGRGLMTMAPLSEDPESARSVFARTAELFYELRQARHGQARFDALSMGMSDDFEVAVEEGSTLVRIGRALFDGT